MKEFNGFDADHIIPAQPVAATVEQPIVKLCRCDDPEGRARMHPGVPGEGFALRFRFRR